MSCVDTKSSNISSMSASSCSALKSSEPRRRVPERVGEPLCDAFGDTHLISVAGALVPVRA